MARLRVLLVTHAYLAEENRKKLSLLGREVELEVVSPDRATTPLFRYRAQRRVLEEDSYTMRFYRPLPEAGIPARYLLLSGDLHLRRFRPDVIHLENAAWSLLSQQVLAYAGLHRSPAAFVLTERQNTYTTYGSMLTPLKDWVARAVIARMDRFIASNQGSRQILEARFGVDPNRIDMVLQLGVDTTHFRPVSAEERRRLRSRWNLSPDALVIGYCGRLVEEKGLLELCEAARMLGAKTRAPLQVALLGDGPLRAQLEREAGIALVLNPAVPHAEVASFLQAVDIFVLPSRVLPRHEEHDAHALLEALSCGLPCLGTTSGAIPEILSGAGLVGPPSDASALADALAQLLDPAARQAWGEAGRRRILERYSNQRIVEAQLGTYQRAVADRRRT